MRKRHIILVLLLLFVSISMWAHEQNAVGDSAPSSQKFMIAGYSFTITGKTTESALRSRIVPAGDEIFPSEEAMRAALDAKVQKLVNLRVFSKVEYQLAYTNESRGIRFYQVTFIIVDASSILPFPYGKYDSNIGTRVGLKLYNKNLFGQLSNLYLAGNVTIPDSAFQDDVGNGWKEGTYYGEMNLSQLALGKQVRLNLATQYSYNMQDPTSSYFYFNFNPQNMTIDHKALSMNMWLYLHPKTADLQGDWYFKQIGNSFNWGPFALSLGGFSLYNKSIAYDVNTSDYYFYTLSHFRYHGFKIGTQQIDTRLSLETKGAYGILDWMDISGTIGTGFNVRDWFNWYNEITLHNKMYPDDPLLYELFWEFNSTLSRSSINWKGNFRTGLDFQIHGNMTIFPKQTFEGRPYYDAPYRWLEIRTSWFPFASSWFNPSFRLSGILSSKKYYFLPSNTDDYVSEYIRGIRDNNDYVSVTGEAWKRALVLNCNFTTSFITLRNFAHSYAIPFVDIALVNDVNGLNNGNDNWLVGAGMEGVVILDRYPAYPIRASLGFNMEDVYRKLTGNGTGSVEYELYIGLYFFF